MCFPPPPQDKVSVCSSGCPGPCSVDQTGSTCPSAGIKVMYVSPAKHLIFIMFIKVLKMFDGFG